MNFEKDDNVYYFTELTFYRPLKNKKSREKTDTKQEEIKMASNEMLAIVRICWRLCKQHCLVIGSWLSAQRT